jgi:hypothetical protein
MNRSKRATVFVAFAAALAAGIAWWTYDVFAMPSVERHSGDGRFENHSWRFPWRTYGLPIPGYLISFDEFDLSKDFAATYEIGYLPIIGREVVVYLCIRDPERKFSSDQVRKRLTNEWKLEVVNGQGKRGCELESPLAKMYWAEPEGGANTYGLYDLDGSEFKATKGGKYEIRVRYTGEPSLKGLKGFVHIRCGGSI